MHRRHFLAAGIATGAAALAAPALAFTLPIHLQPTRVAVRETYAPGTIVVVPQTHFLYWIEPGGTAMRYGVGVGRAGTGVPGCGDDQAQGPNGPIGARRTK